MGALQSLNSTEEKPRVIWKWEYPPNHFNLYPPEVSTAIERYFLAGFMGSFEIDVPNSSIHTIDLDHMIQTDKQTLRQSRIMREINQDPKVNIEWSWENDSGEMEAYSPNVSNQIEACYHRGDANFTHVIIGGQEYWIDLKNHFQISVATMKKRRIERNVIPDHKFIWKWQNDNGKFISYLEATSRKIEANYFLKPDSPLLIVTPIRRYFVDVQKMCEINESDGKIRLIKRVLENYIRYKWFWKDEESRWNSFSSYLSDKIEANYLSIDANPINIIINLNEFEIDTKAMIQRDTMLGRVYKIKRKPISNDFAVWGWSTKPGIFKTFPSSVSKLIESHYLLNDPTPLIIKNQYKQYEIDIRTKNKVNCLSEGQKKLERKLISNNFPPNLDLLPKSECLKIFKFLAQDGSLPQDWDCHQKEEVQTFQASDTEWNLLSEEFFRTMSSNDWFISSIFRIQNVSLINSFILEKVITHQCYHCSEEPELMFFIPNKETNYEALYNGVENTLEGHFSPRNDFGRGYYFTKSAKICKEYAWEKEDGTKLLICFWVLVGRTREVKVEDNLEVLYNKKYKFWSEVTKAPLRVDCNKAIIDGEEIFIIYNATKCYPLYIVEYNQAN